MKRGAPLRRSPPKARSSPLKPGAALKRGVPLERRTPLQPGEPLRAGEALQRSTPLQRSAPLTTRTALQRTGPPRTSSTAHGRTAGLKAKPKAPRSAAEITAMKAWHTAILAAGRCQACGTRTRHLEAHHVLPKRMLKPIETRLGLDPGTLQWDVRCGMALCAGLDSPNRCHEAHESAVRRVPRAAVPASAWQMAAQLELLVEIERMYPPPA